MESVGIHYNGSRVIFRTENNLYNSMDIVLQLKGLCAEFLKGPFLDRYYFFYILMIFVKLQMP